jgi:hypothetical protein
MAQEAAVASQELVADTFCLLLIRTATYWLPELSCHTLASF